MAEPPANSPPSPELRAFPRVRRSARPMARPGKKALVLLPPIQRAPRGGLLPASAYQQWAWEALDGKANHDINLAFAIRYTAPLSVPALFASLLELERRQEGLRTSLAVAEDEPRTVCQRIHPPGQLETPLIDLSVLGAPQRRGELGRIAVENVLLPLDLARPMFRVRLVRLDDACHALLINVSHMVSDGWSLEILRNELEALYAAFSAGRPSPLPELPVQFADFAAWQQRIEESDVVAGQLEYWTKRLEGIPPPLELTGDRRLEQRGGSVQASCRFSPLETARIRGLARAEAGTVPMVVLAAFGMLLASYTEETDLAIEAKVLGRMQPELHSIIGLFMGSLCHRLDLSGAPGFTEALWRTRDRVLEDYDHQDAPYPYLLRRLFPGRRCLSRIAFNPLLDPHQVSSESRELEDDIFSDEGRRPDVERTRYDLMLEVREDPEKIQLMIMADACRFHREAVAEIVDDLKDLIVHALDHPEGPVERLLPRPRFRYNPATGRCP